MAPKLYYIEFNFKLLSYRGFYFIRKQQNCIYGCIQLGFKVYSPLTNKSKKQQPQINLGRKFKLSPATRLKHH